MVKYLVYTSVICWKFFILYLKIISLNVFNVKNILLFCSISLEQYNKT